MWKRGRKEAGNPCELLFQTQICVCISPNLLIYPRHFTFFLNSWFEFEFSVCLRVVNSFFCFTFFILPRRDILCYCLPLFGWVPLGYDPSRSVPVATSGTTSSLQYSGFMANSPSYICSTSCLSLICEWRCCCLSVSAIVSSATGLVGVHVSFRMMDFSGSRPRHGDVRF